MRKPSTLDNCAAVAAQWELTTERHHVVGLTLEQAGLLERALLREGLARTAHVRRMSKSMEVFRRAS